MMNMYRNTFLCLKAFPVVEAPIWMFLTGFGFRWLVEIRPYCSKCSAQRMMNLVNSKVKRKSLIRFVLLLQDVPQAITWVRMLSPKGKCSIGLAELILRLGCRDK